MSTSFAISAPSWHIDYHVYVRTNSGLPHAEWAYMKPAQFVACRPGELPPESAPALELRKDDLQQLMDELWRVGIRPSEGTGSAGALAATERHLADMRSLVFAREAAQKPSHGLGDH